jgi:hypothetical protein
LISPTLTPNSIFRPCLVKALSASLAICSSAAPRKAGHGLEHRDLGAQAAPHRAHLQADHTRADQAQLLRHRADAQRAVVAEHALLVEGRARQARALEPVATITMLADQRVVSPLTAIVAAVDGLHERAAAVEER